MVGEVRCALKVLTLIAYLLAQSMVSRLEAKFWEFGYVPDNKESDPNSVTEDISSLSSVTEFGFFGLDVQLNHICRGGFQSIFVAIYSA